MTTLKDVLDFIEDHKDEDWEICLRQIHLAVEKVDKDRKDKTKKGLKPLPVEAIEIAEYLGEEIAKRYPFAKTEPLKWAKDIEEINRLDNHDWNTIKTIARFSQEDDFWSMNIRSGKKLRKHFDTLMIKAQSYYKQKMKDRVVTI